LRLNAAGESLVEAAEELERAALTLERRRAPRHRIERHRARLCRRVGGAVPGAPPVGRVARRSGVGITLELVESPEMANLARRDADLAVRHSHAIPQTGNLYVTKLGDIACAVYQRRGINHAGVGCGHRWIAYPKSRDIWPAPSGSTSRSRPTAARSPCAPPT
jgi:DNA-binding transcriptional LysR family regulator